jgi:serine/threonine-protein kinase RsbW
VTGSAAKEGLDTEMANRLELAVEEWVVNVCEHAYGGRGGTIEVVLRKERGQLFVEITDEGTPFDPLKAPEPNLTAPLDQRQPGGLGLLLIRRMTDGVSYARVGGRNVVTLTVSTSHS